jgi:phosphohistidine phosphatase SixA
MDQRRTLLVLRHAETEDMRPGSKDSERRLTPDGERHALEVGDYLRSQGITIDAVLCSSAARAQQTLELLKLGQQRPRIAWKSPIFSTTQAPIHCSTPYASSPTIVALHCSWDTPPAYPAWCTK